MFEKIMEDIENDAQLQKLLKLKDPQMEERIEAILRRRYFTKLEVFINAPDSEYAAKQLGMAFKLTKGISKEDLTSPKMKTIYSPEGLQAVPEVKL
jgi:hypothetical protein